MRRFKLLFFCLALANALFAQPAKFMDDIYYYIENTSVFELNQERRQDIFYAAKNNFIKRELEILL